MKSFSTLVACAIVYSLLAAPSSAQLTVFSQPAFVPATLDMGAFSTRTKSLPDPESAIAYDNFTLPGPAASYDVNALSWEGLYDEAFPANRGETNFLIEIWPHNVNGPDLGAGAIYSTTLFAGVSGVSDGVVPTTDLGYDSRATATTPGGGDAFHYEAFLPSSVTLASATKYWLSIQALQTFPNAKVIDPQWQWHLGSGPGDGFYAQDTLLDPAGTADFGISQAGKDLAFELEAVPEPSTCVLMFAGMVGLGLIRRRR